MEDMLSLFVAGVLSFFSPCVVSLIPLYMSYLTQGAKSYDEKGKIVYKRSKVLITTIFFVLGILTVFMFIGIFASFLQKIMVRYDILFRMFSGFVLIFFGLMAMNVINVPFLNKEHKLNVKFDFEKMDFLKAYFFGFVFSFSWTPCIGPLMASAISKAALAASGFLSFVYIASYAFGFILVFLLLGLFTERVLDFIKNNQKIIQYTGILAGVVILSLGVNLVYGSSKSIMALAEDTGGEVLESKTDENLSEIEKYDFILKNGKGEEVQLSDFKGKTVLMSFYGTWCHYCNLELPLLEEMAKSRDDVEIILIATPSDGMEKDIAGVEAYMKDKGYTLPVLYDVGRKIYTMYGVNGFPTSFIYKPDGSMLGYLPGYVDGETLNQIIEKSFE